MAGGGVPDDENKRAKTDNRQGDKQSRLARKGTRRSPAARNLSAKKKTLGRLFHEHYGLLRASDTKRFLKNGRRKHSVQNRIKAAKIEISGLSICCSKRGSCQDQRRSNRDAIITSLSSVSAKEPRKTWPRKKSHGYSEGRNHISEKGTKKRSWSTGDGEGRGHQPPGEALRTQ